jgi:hypothetical protein
MHSRGDDVRRWFIAKLHDVLTQVSFHDLGAHALEGLVQPNLLGQHRFRLDDRSAARVPDDLTNE